MAQQARLAMLFAGLLLTACDSGEDDTKDGGNGKPNDAGAKDATVAEDSATDADGGTGDAAGSTDDAGGGDATVGDGGNKISSIHGGSVSALTGVASTAKGAALLVRTTDQHSLVSLQVSGLLANKKYPAHVHNMPCAMMAGGHYQHVVDGGVDAINEVWPELNTDDAGQARAYLDVSKSLRDDAKAVVVHDPDMANTPKMLCADLSTKSPFTTTGTAAALPGAAAAGVPSASGSGSLTRDNEGSTQVTITVQNLKPSTDYMVHVHDQPCAFGNGGGHYKFDYGVDAAVASNEIWLDFKSDASGAGTKSVTITNHIARAEAQAIVVHAMDNTRLACIDLKL
jgi:Cu-Zn family superoxide dismutase